MFSVYRHLVYLFRIMHPTTSSWVRYPKEICTFLLRFFAHYVLGVKQRRVFRGSLFSPPRRRIGIRFHTSKCIDNRGAFQYLFFGKLDRINRLMVRCGCQGLSEKTTKTFFLTLHFWPEEENLQITNYYLIYFLQGILIFPQNMYETYILEFGHFFFVRQHCFVQNYIMI